MCIGGFFEPQSLLICAYDWEFVHFIAWHVLLLKDDQNCSDLIYNGDGQTVDYDVCRWQRPGKRERVKVGICSGEKRNDSQ